MFLPACTTCLMKSLISASVMACGTPPERGQAIADGPIRRPGTVVALC